MENYHYLNIIGLLRRRTKLPETPAQDIPILLELERLIFTIRNKLSFYDCQDLTRIVIEGNILEVQGFIQTRQVY